ncbi:MAG: hypothetical protein HBSAPP03_02720 [Phycisphaerae bacterium]|nr:MAG: hypothetical protein HBSAPP03_02720 [Phycisphaerae bacterium]
MANLNNFDANNVDPSVALDPIPAGKYIAVITETEMKPTKAGGGKYLQLTFQIVDGDHKGRLVWARLNLENKSEMTVKIARGELSAICRAVGVMAPKDSVELHNIPLEINVGLKKRDDNGEFTNVIKGYGKKGCGGAAGARVPVGVGPGSLGGTPPWKR